ncbi:esterase-like activity of phytase family protein [Roseobacteraceae bacterium NS-SX3]
MRRGTAIKLILPLAAAAGLAAAALAANRPQAATGTAELAGEYVWRMKAPWFGGFSGIHVHGDGSSATLLSDRATLATARIRRSSGQITGITVQSARHLRSSRGDFLTRRIMDSEGLAVAPDGTLYISFEGVARVARHKTDTSRARVLPRPDAFRKLPLNKALEALAIDSRGRLYTLPEKAYDSAGNIPVWRWQGGKWRHVFSLPPRGGFLPVSADFGPDGRFYLLERDFGLFGFRSRLRRWDITARGASGETQLLQTAWGTHDNLEGLSVWHDGSGRLRATMISDDNFKAVQRTEVVEYWLPQ